MLPTQGRPSLFWKNAAALILLALLPVTILGGAISGQRVLVPADQLQHFAAWQSFQHAPPPWDILYWDDLAQLLPWQAEAQRDVHQGRVPLWNHDAAGGAALLANTQTSALSPCWLLFQAGGLGRAQGWLAWLQLWMAGAGSFAFFRRQKLLRLPALLGAAAYQLSGWSLGWVEFPNRHGPVAWFPVCLWLLGAALDGVPGAWAGAGAAVAISVLSSHLQFEFYLILGLAVYAAFRTAAASGGASRRAILFATFLGILTLGLLLAAFQLLPAAELGRYSARLTPRSWEAYGARMRFSMPAWWLAQAFVPGVFGYPSQGSMVGFLAPGPVPFFSANAYEFCVFVGTIPLYLSARGIRQARRQPLALFLALLGLVALLLAAGSILNAVLYFGLPGFSAMAGSARMLYLFAFAIAGLAAVGLQDLLSGAGSNPKPTPPSDRADAAGSGAQPRSGAPLWVPILDAAILAAVGALFVAAAAAILPTFASIRPPNSPHAVLMDSAGGAVLPAILLAVGAATALAIRWRPALSLIGSLVLLALTAGQLLLFGQNLVRTASPSDLFPVTPVIQAIQARHPFRIVNVASRWTFGPPFRRAPENLLGIAPLPPNTSDYYGISSLDSYDSLDTRSYVSYITQAVGHSPFPAENGNMTVVDSVQSPLIREAGVDLAISTAPLQGAGLGSPIQVGDVYLYPLIGASPPAYLDRPGAPAPRVRLWAAGQIQVDEVEGPGNLVVLDAWAPGWEARVDGVLSPIRTAAGLFKSIKVSAGVHRVTLEYRPLSFRLGLFLSAAALAWTVCILISRRGGRSAGRSSDVESGEG